MVPIIKKPFLHFLFLTAFIIGGFFTTQNRQNANAQTASQNVDFFVDWSAQTYAPAEYGGKALPTYGSKITLSATPLSYVNENNYIYNWIIDAEDTPNDNGEPIASFISNKTSGGEHSVYLAITDRKTDKVIKEIGIMVPIFAPKTIIYKQTSAGAILPLNNDNIFSSGSEVSLVALPFFFNRTISGQILDYQWKINNQKIGGAVAEPNKLSIAFPKNISAGTEYQLSLFIENPMDAFQFAEKNYRLTIR